MSVIILLSVFMQVVAVQDMFLPKLMLFVYFHFVALDPASINLHTLLISTIQIEKYKSSFL
jgi:hypothetical protein